MEHHKRSPRRNTAGQLILGAVLILIGLGIITDLLNIGSWNFRHIVFSWQMLLIVLGIVFISSKDSKPTGYILLAIGGFFIVPRIFHNVYDDWNSLFWPVMLILLGILIIFHRSRSRSKPEHRSEFSEDYLDDVTVFGGGDKIIRSQEFRGGKITHIFGGSKYIFTDAQLAKGRHELELNMIFGGTKLVVPEGWDIKLEMTSIFGGFSDKRARSIVVVDPERTLIIKGANIFGGGELVNF